MMRAVEIRTFIAYAVKVVLSGCSVVTASNDGAQFLRDSSFKMTQSSLLCSLQILRVD
jgi:hypothetical protein